jgi:hypothetical protein
MNANTLDNLSFEQLVPKDSKFLTKEDCGEDGILLTIAGFTSEDMKSDDGSLEHKVLMHFAEDVKPMILNRTNSQLLAQATGATVAGAAKGKQIIVVNDPSVSFGGKITGGLRIRKVPGPARQPAAPARVNARAPAAPPQNAREPGSDDNRDFNDEPNF